MSNEFSELQAVDFGLGSFIAAAFTDLNNQRGPKEYREFLCRPVSRQVFRHDADSPAEFLKKYRASKAAEKIAAGAKENQVELPLLYYYRKPGLTDGSDKEVTRRGRYSFEAGLKNAYNLMMLPIVFDYKLFILAWDKPTLDSLQLAWYAYQVRHDKFTVKYKLGDDDDLFEVPAHLLDNKSLLTADESITQDSSRVYAVSMGLQVATDILFGAEVSVPDSVTMVGGLANYAEIKYTIGISNGIDLGYDFDSAQQFSKKTSMIPGTLKIYANDLLVGRDDSEGGITGSGTTGLRGIVSYDDGVLSWALIDAIPEGARIWIAFAENNGSSVVIASACPTCHKYGCDI